MKLIIIALIAFSLFANENASEIDPKIVRGYEARLGQFEFFSFLEITSTSGQSMGCGASILSNKWLLTAAHCLADARNLTAHFGIANLNHLSSDFLAPEHIAIPVPEFNFYPHPGYFIPIAWNDIGEENNDFFFYFNNFQVIIFL